MASVFEAGSAALRRVISDPLGRRKRMEEAEQTLDSDVAPEETLNAIIKQEIIPQLLVAHAGDNGSGPQAKAISINANDAKRFAALPLTKEASDLLDEIDAFLDRGVPVESIYIDLLAPAARKLGQMWEEDECDFIDVTMGLWRLQEVMREVASRTPSVFGALSAKRSVLFAPMPGDQHTFGPVMLDEVFCRAGWDSQVLVECERRKLLNLVSTKSFDVLGLTVTRDCPSAALTHVINATRSVSANPNLVIMIGGKMVNQNPEIVSEVGADGTATDARKALEVADGLVDAVQLAGSPR